jgi:acyl carrier protein
VKNDSREEKRQVVVQLLARVFGEEIPLDELSGSNPKWDSLKQLQISLEIEDQFKVELTEEQASEFFDVESILNLLDRILNDVS